MCLEKVSTHSSLRPKVMVTKQIVLLTTIDLGWSLASFWYANQGVGPPTPSAFNFEQRMCLEKVSAPQVLVARQNQ
jgi:hypothetical protein